MAVQQRECPQRCWSLHVKVANWMSISPQNISMLCKPGVNTATDSYMTEEFKTLSTKVIHLCKNTATSFQEIKGTQQTANVYGKRMILECSSLLFSDLHVVCTRHKNWEKGKKKSKRTTSTALSHVFSLKYIVRFRNEISVKYFQFRLKTHQTFPKRETRAHHPTPTSRARSQT